MPGRSRRGNRREEIIAIDLGTKTTKAVLLRRRGTDYHLLNYVLAEAPASEKAFSRSVWADHVRKLTRSLGGSTRRLALAVGPGTTFLTHAELPEASASDLRKMVKLSPKNYVQQDLPDHVFDCYATPSEQGDSAARSRRKARVLVAAARRSLIEDLVDGARDAGYTVEHITLSQVATANAFAAASADPSEEASAFLDIGFRNSTISILLKGRLALVRVVHAGAEQLADALQVASSHGASLAHDEEENPALDALQVSVQKAIRVLAKEVDASIGFFLSQHEIPVHQVYVSGGSARSHLILQTLEMELSVPCRVWNPAVAFKHDGAVGGGDLEYEAPQLTVAIGAAVGALDSELIGINLLAEQIEEAAWRRRDPVRRARWLAGAALLSMGMWAGWLGWEILQAHAFVRSAELTMRELQEGSGQPILDSQLAADFENRAAALEKHGRQRVLVANILNALQYLDVPTIQFHRLQIERVLKRIEPPRRRPRREAKAEPEPPKVEEQFILRIQGKNYGGEFEIEKLMDTIQNHEFFRDKLQDFQPVRMVESLPEQLDPADPERTFARFAIECRFALRTFVYE